MGGGSETCPYVIRTGVRAGLTCGKFHTEHRCFSRLDNAWRAEFGDDVERPRWAELLRSGVAIFDLDFDAIISAMYALSFSAEGDCYLCVPPYPGIAAAALGASACGTPTGTAPAEALHTFTLDSGASRCLHLPSFSTNLVSTAALQDAMVTTTTPGGSSLYTLATEPPQTLLWHHRLGCPSLPRLRGMHSRFLISGLPRSLPPLPPSPAPPCGRERYFLLVVDDYTRYTTVFPLRSKGEVVDVLIPWIRIVRLQLRERFGTDLPILRLHSDRGGWQFYYPTSCRILPSQDVTFDESVPFYHLFPYRSAPPPPPPLFLTPGPPPVDPLPPQGPASLGVSQVDPLPVQVAVGSGAAPGAASEGAAGGAGSEGAGSGVAELGGAGPEGVEPGGAESEGAESRGAARRGAASFGGPAGASPRLCWHQLREWLVQRAHRRSGTPRAGGAGYTGAGGAAVTARAGGTGGTAASGPGGARTSAGSGGAGAGGAGVGGPGAGGAGAAGAGVGGTGAGGARAAGAGAVDPGAGGAGGTVRPRPYFVPLLQQVLGVPTSPGLPPPILCPPPDQSQPPLQPASPLPAPSPYTEQSGGLTERCEPASRPVSPVCTARRAPRSRPPPVPGTHAMALRPSSVPLRVPLPAPPESSLPEVPDPASDQARAARPTVSHLLATAITDPSFESAATSPLVAELLEFAAACRLDSATALVAESVSASPPSVGGECALGTDVLEDRQEDFESLEVAVPRFASMLLAPEGDPDAPDIPTPRSYAEAIMGPYSSQWQAAMDAEMASWKSTGTYVDEFPPSSANIVDGMWIFRGSLHEEIWLRRSPGFTGTFPAGTQWSLRQPLYSLCQAPREWHDTLRTTLAALGFAPSTADPSLFLRTDTSLPPFYILVYVNDLVFAIADIKALTLVKSELQKRHICTDQGELRSYLGLQITRDRARCTITLTQSHMVHQVLQRFGFQFSSPLSTPLSTSHSLSALPSDEFVESSGPYPELLSCLMYLMTCTQPDLTYPLSLLARYVAPGRHRKVHWDAAKRVLRYLCSTSDMGLVLGGRGPVVLTRHADASLVDDSATQRSSQGYTFSLGSGSVSWRSTRSSLIHSSCCEAEIYAGAMDSQELCWLTYLLTDLGEQPRSSPRGQLRLAYVATRANTADVFTKALPPGDHQRFATVLVLLALLFLNGGTGASGPRGACIGGTGAPGAGGAAGVGAGDPGAGDTGAGDTGAGGAGPGGAGSVGAGFGDTGWPRPYFSQPPLQPAFPLPARSPYTKRTRGLTKRREHVSRPVSPVRAFCTGRHVPRPRSPPVPGTHHMAIRPSSVPLCVPLPSPPASSLPDGPNPESDLARATSPTVPRLLATVVTDPLFESAAASALVAELVYFAAAYRLDHATSLVSESEQEDFECFEAAVPHLMSMLIAPEGDPDAPDIPTPRSYVEAITGPYSSQCQTAMDVEMASWKSTSTYVDAVPPSGVNIVDGMWIFRVKRSSGSPPVFKARYVARGISQCQGVDFFHTFSPTPKMTTLWILLHVAAQRDYEIHSLDFTTAFLQGSLHEEIWLRRPSGSTESFPAGRPVADPSLLQCAETSLPPFYIIVYVLQRFGFQYSSPQSTPLPTCHSLSAPPSDESVVLSGPYPELVGCLMYLMTCTRPDLAYPLSILARYVAPGRHRPEHWEAAKRVLRYLCSTSGMRLVLGGQGPVGYTLSLGSGSVSWRSTRSSSVLSSSCEAEIYAGAMAAQELRWLTYLLTDLGERPRSSPHRGQLPLPYVAIRANAADIFTKALQSGDHQHFCVVLGLVPSLPH
ncbi:unnamed protein product [Closterium sp. NIES-53]